MKRFASELDLEALLQPVGGETDDHHRPQPPPAAIEDLLLPAAASQKPGGDPFADVCGDLGFPFGDRETLSSHSTGVLQAGSQQLWSQNPTPKHSSISATIESQSSICAGTPTSAHKPKGRENQAPGGTSGSEQSDDESFEFEPGSCEQSTNVSDLKRMRRYN